MKACYVFVNWNTRDIISTYSRPYDYKVGVINLPQGRKAKQLLDSGYQCIGWYSGMNASLIKYK